MPREYAKASARFAAFAMDGLLLVMFLVSMFLSLFFYGGAIEPGGSAVVETLTFILSVLLLFGLFGFAIWNTIYRIGKTGQSLGCKAAHVAVLDDEGNPIGFGRAFLRQTIGRFISGIVFFVGYMSFFWDNDRQTWHDKMVDSYVYSVPENFSADEERFADLGEH